MTRTPESSQKVPDSPQGLTLSGRHTPPIHHSGRQNLFAAIGFRNWYRFLPFLGGCGGVRFLPFPLPILPILILPFPTSSLLSRLQVDMTDSVEGK